MPSSTSGQRRLPRSEKRSQCIPSPCGAKRRAQSTTIWMAANAIAKRYMSITNGVATPSATRENIKLKPKMELPHSAASIGHFLFFTEIPLLFGLASR